MSHDTGHRDPSQPPEHSLRCGRAAFLPPPELLFTLALALQQDGPTTQEQDVQSVARPPAKDGQHQQDEPVQDVRGTEPEGQEDAGTEQRAGDDPGQPVALFGVKQGHADGPADHRNRHTERQERSAPLKPVDAPQHHHRQKRCSQEDRPTDDLPPRLHGGQVVPHLRERVPRRPEAPRAVPSWICAHRHLDSSAAGRPYLPSRSRSSRAAGGPGKIRRTPANHSTTSSSAAPPTTHSVFSLGGCTAMKNSTPTPSTHSAASGRYQTPRSHGPIRVHDRPYATIPSAAGSTYETYSSTAATAAMVS